MRGKIFLRNPQLVLFINLNYLNLSFQYFIFLFRLFNILIGNPRCSVKNNLNLFMKMFSLLITTTLAAAEPFIVRWNIQDEFPISNILHEHKYSPNAIVHLLLGSSYLDCLWLGMVTQFSYHFSLLKLA